METLQDDITYWSKMIEIIDERLAEIVFGSDMHTKLVRARERYVLMIASAQ